MAVPCASCGRADLMQAQVRTYQCLACGAVTNDDLTPQTPQDEGPNLSNAGFPVVELGEPAEVALAPSGETAPEAPVEPVEPSEAEPEVVEPEPEIAAPVELPVDLSTLTPEQIDALRTALA